MEGLHPPDKSTRTKKEYCSLPPSANAFIFGMAGLLLFHSREQTKSKIARSCNESVGWL